MKDEHMRPLPLREADANRHDPEWGDPVQQLALHCGHWLEVAIARHPEREDEILELGRRLDEAAGDRSDADGVLAGTDTEGEIVVALEGIIAIMREVAPLVRDPTRGS